MKTNIITSISLLGYAFLFFNQSIGINFLIFNILTIVGSLVLDKELLKSKLWLFMALGAILGGIGTTLFGNLLSAIVSSCCIAFMAVSAAIKNGSFAFIPLHSLYNAVSFITQLYIAVEDYLNAPNKKPHYKLRNWLVIIIPLIIVSIFFSLYKSSNPLFDNLTKQFTLEFISWSLIRFLCLGALITYLIYRPSFIKDLVSKDGALEENLNAQMPSKGFNIFKSITAEHSSALILFAALNLLLLLVNYLDVQFLLGQRQLAKGMNHSSLVHESVNTLIFSIIIAIAVTLYYFRSQLNFINNSRPLKSLVYLWIAQNMVLVILCAQKNLFYIEEWGLTYKRIGVFIYLLLTTIGLVTTALKIVFVKSNWFLIRKNAWAFYFVFIASCLVHWDLIIIEYNFTKAKFCDKNYLYNLSKLSIPYLIQDKSILKIEVIDPYEKKYNREYGYWTDQKISMQLALKKDKAYFILVNNYLQWPSWNLSDQRLFQQLKAL